MAAVSKVAPSPLAPRSRTLKTSALALSMPNDTPSNTADNTAMIFTNLVGTARLRCPRRVQRRNVGWEAHRGQDLFRPLNAGGDLASAKSLPFHMAALNIYSKRITVEGSSGRTPGAGPGSWKPCYWCDFGCRRGFSTYWRSYWYSFADTNPGMAAARRTSYWCH